MAELELEIMKKTSPGIRKKRFKPEREIDETHYDIYWYPAPAAAEHGAGEGTRALLEKLESVRGAQKIYSEYSQDRVDKIFAAAASAANKERIRLAKLAVGETGMGIAEDKVIKNHFAAEYVYNAYRDAKTCGVIEEDRACGIVRIAEPVGVVAAVIPTTNPTSTTIFKALLALKTRNGMIISPHPRAKKCTAETARIILEAAVRAGAPEGIIAWIDEPTIELTNILMSEADLILATGGPGMVRAAYSSGTPAIGVGSGNTPAIVDETADLKMAAASIIHSKSFDNGVICASEQSVIVVADAYDAMKRELAAIGAHFMGEEETELTRRVIFKNGTINARIVGQSAAHIAELAGFSAPPGTKVLVGEVQSVGLEEPFAHEKLSPVLAMYRAADFGEAMEYAHRLVMDGGPGHTSVLYTDPAKHRDRIDAFGAKMKTGRVLVNMPSSHGAIGDLYNFRLAPSLTLGCGTWGGNSVSENVGVKHLLNTKVVAERRENMLWFRSPGKIYIKRGCLPFALEDLKADGRKRAFVVTDAFLYQNGYAKLVTGKLDGLGIEHAEFFDVAPDPTLACAREGARAMAAFGPDCVIALGGGSAMDAAKIMWVLYEHPDADFADMAMRFADIRKRVYEFPKMGRRACFVAIPTSAGTGSEVTPFAVITDQDAGIKYPLADYELMPNMAIVDADLMMNAPKGLTAASGIDALTHALEAHASMLATDYTDGLAISAMRLVFEYLPRAYEDGPNDPEAREKMANAATIAGMAFANAFLGVCHSMAHKLGAFHHIPHGVANALLIEEVIRYNAATNPSKMGTFPQYAHPRAGARYAAIADALGLGGAGDSEKIENLISSVRSLKEKVGIKKSISEYGVDEKYFLETLDEMTEHAFDDQCTGANPRYPLMSEIKEMYLRAYYGGERDKPKKTK